MKIYLVLSILFFNILCCANAQVGYKADSATYLDPIKKELHTVWPDNHTINLVFHGHSVVAGYQDHHEVHTFESYPYLLLKKLKHKYPFAVINIIITAKGGENSLQGQKRFGQEVLIHHPDVLFIDYALNDIGVGLPTAKRSWEKMISEAVKKNIKVILLTPSPDQREDLLNPHNQLSLHAEQIRGLARKYHIGLADSYAAFQKKEQSGADIKIYMSHVNHPDRKGNEVIATEIMKWFE